MDLKLEYCIYLMDMYCMPAYFVPDTVLGFWGYRREKDRQNSLLSWSLHSRLGRETISQSIIWVRVISDGDKWDREIWNLWDSSMECSCKDDLEKVHWEDDTWLKIFQRWGSREHLRCNERQGLVLIDLVWEGAWALEEPSWGGAQTVPSEWKVAGDGVCKETRCQTM